MNCPECKQSTLTPLTTVVTVNGSTNKETGEMEMFDKPKKVRRGLKEHRYCYLCNTMFWLNKNKVPLALKTLG